VVDIGCKCITCGYVKGLRASRTKANMKNGTSEDVRAIVDDECAGEHGGGCKKYNMKNDFIYDKFKRP
jgi:hypothetical protein